MKHLPRTAFTLIELLVAIAIVAILATVLLPSISNVRLASLNAKDANNLRQAGSVLLQYASENDGNFPPVTSGYYSFSASLLNTGYIDPHTSFFSSPFDPNTARVVEAGKTPRSYVMIEPAMTPNYKQYSIPRSVYSFKNPSEVGMLTIWVRDATVAIDQVSVEGRYGGAIEYPVQTDDKAAITAGRQDGGRNIVFADGHVAFFLPNELRPNTHPAWGRQVGAN